KKMKLSQRKKMLRSQIQHQKLKLSQKLKLNQSRKLNQSQRKKLLKKKWIKMNLRKKKLRKMNQNQNKKVKRKENENTDFLSEIYTSLVIIMVFCNVIQQIERAHELK
ncbi:MAG: hypothetical protein EZS28_023819, partial [Streblomastix strix]